MKEHVTVATWNMEQHDAPTMHIAHLIEKKNVGHCDQNLIKVMYIY